MNKVKRIGNVLLILIGVVLIVVCADLISNKLGKTSLHQLDEVDRGAIEEICAMTALFDERYGSDEIWNESYDLRRCPCVLTRSFGFVKGYTYIVNMDYNKSIFSQKIKMPSEYEGISVYRLSYLTPMTFSLIKEEDGSFVDIRGRSVYTYVFDKPKVLQNGAGSLEDGYVKSSFANMVESADVPQKDTSVHYELKEENIALTGLQYRIIDDMLAAESKQQLKELIAEYVLVREYQKERYPDFALTQEQIELEEGCAQYVFYKISGKIGHNFTFFNKEESEAITFYSAYYYLCTGRYNSDVSEFLDYSGNEYAGAALCRIIDDNELDKKWESRINGSPDDKLVSPYTILKRYCDKSCKEFSDKSLDDIKKAYNYDEIVSMAKSLVEGVGVAAPE